jgi:hypothetical protein
VLGEKIGSETGKVTSQRVLPNPGGGPKMETSFRASGERSWVSVTPPPGRIGRSFEGIERFTAKAKRS